MLWRQGCLLLRACSCSSPCAALCTRPITSASASENTNARMPSELGVPGAGPASSTIARISSTARLFFCPGEPPPASEDSTAIWIATPRFWNPIVGEGGRDGAGERSGGGVDSSVLGAGWACCVGVSSSLPLSEVSPPRIASGEGPAVSSSLLPFRLTMTSGSSSASKWRTHRLRKPPYCR